MLIIKKNICYFLFFTLFLSFVEACVRGDVEGALEKSRALAGGISHPDFQALPNSQNTVVIVEEKEGYCTGNVSSGVLITPMHVLTAAHSRFLTSENQIFVSNSPTISLAFTDGKLAAVEKVHIHPSFKHGTPRQLGIWANRERIEEIRKLLKKNLDELLSTFYKTFSGVDLAILKLKMPINITTPLKFFIPQPDSSSLKVENCYGVCFGYCTQKVNQPPHMLSYVPQDQTSPKHVISCKFSLHELLSVLYAEHETCVWKGDDESFVIKEGMRRTEGLPVSGDSGGPLFIEVGENRELFLAGITSRTSTVIPNIDPKTQTSFQETFKREVGPDITLPIHPIWTAIWPYMGWIQDVLAPNYVLTDGCFLKASTLSIN